MIQTTAARNMGASGVRRLAGAACPPELVRALQSRFPGLCVQFEGEAVAVYSSDRAERLFFKLAPSGSMLTLQHQEWRDGSYRYTLPAWEAPIYATIDATLDQLARQNALRFQCQPPPPPCRSPVGDVLSRMFPGRRIDVQGRYTYLYAGSGTERYQFELVDGYDQLDYQLQFLENGQWQYQPPYSIGLAVRTLGGLEAAIRFGMQQVPIDV
jgi:hypothetical protein